MPIGIYQPDATEGITRVQDLPKPITVKHGVNHASRPCPACGCPATRLRTQHRTLHDLDVTCSQHHCKPCDWYFNVDMLDLTLSGVEGAMPGGHHTSRVVAAAVRPFDSAQGEVVEDGLPYQAASWRLWRDPRVFVPAATRRILGGGGGGKRHGAGRRRVPRRRAGRLRRARRHR